MIQNVELANTFNQFRETTNLIIAEVNTLSDGTGVLTIDTITANDIIGLTSANAYYFYSANASNIEFGTIDNARTTGASANSANTLVLRDENGDFGSRRITSTIATGTSPLVVSSTTVVSNLNADKVDGKDVGTLSAAGGIVYASSTSALAGTAAGTSGQAVISGGAGAPTFQNVSSSNGASSIVSRDADGDFSSRRITSTIATGTSPFVVSSTTVVSNLNADKVDGKDVGTLSAAGGIVYATSTTAMAGSVAGTAGQAVISGGSGVPTFQNVSSSNGASSIVSRDANGSFSAYAVTTVSVSGNGSGLTNLNASNVATGTLNNDRTTASSSNGASSIVARNSDGNFNANTIYATKFSGSGAELTDLNAANVTTGTINNDRTTASSANGASLIVARDEFGNFSANIISASTFSGDFGGNGATLTDLNASNVATGTLNNDRTTGSSSNGASTLVLRDTNGSFSANVITLNHVSGNGVFLSSINASNITTGSLSNDRTTGSSSNGASTLVLRNADGSFSANAVTTVSVSGNGSGLTSLNATSITSGTLTNDRTSGSSSNGASTLVLRDADGSFSANVITLNHVSGNGIFLSSINASNITTGTLTNDRTSANTANSGSTLVLRNASGDFAARNVTVSNIIGNGSQLTDLNASNVATGTLDNSRTTGTSSSTASTLVLRDSNGDFSSRRITSTIATGTSPFAVTSTTVVSNLNADKVDGKDVGTLSAAGGIVYASSTSALAGTAAGTAGQAVISGGSGAPTFQNVSSSNGASSIVSRDANGSFSANVVNITTLQSAELSYGSTNCVQRSANTTVATTSLTAIDTFSSSGYRSAKYFVQMTNLTRYHALELTVLHDNANVFISQYGEIVTSTSLGTFDASISTGTLSLFVTPTFADTQIKFSVTQIPV